MNKYIPLVLAVIITSFVFISCSDDSDSSLNNNNTSGNHAPETPRNPFPADNATGVPRLFLTLAWVCGDPDAGDTLKYDLWMANVNPPDHLLASDLRPASYSLPYLLAADTVFYWKIVAKDLQGATTTGPVWRFTTGSTSY
jgi:hypothetical protein